MRSNLLDQGGIPLENLNFHNQKNIRSRGVVERDYVVEEVVECPEF